MSASTREEFLSLAAAAVPEPNEVLALRLGTEEYGIDILRVQEIRSFDQPTRRLQFTATCLLAPV